MGDGGEQGVIEGRADDAPVTETLDDMLAGDDSGLCAGLLDVLALLAEVGAARWLLHKAGKLSLVAAPGGYGFREPFAPEVIDAALGELAEAGLVTIDEAEFEEADDGDDPDGAGEPAGFEDPGTAEDADDEDADYPDDLQDEGLEDEDLDEGLDDEDLEDSAFDTVTVDPDAAEIIVARHVAAGTIAEAGARACALLEEAARSDADIDYALLADGMTACWDQLLPHLGAADDELVKDLLSMRGWGLCSLTFYPDVSVAGMIEFGEKLVADYELALGPGHPDAWETRRNMAMVYGRCGRDEEAVNGFARLCADKERALPAGDSEILEARSDLANGYLNVGRYPEAVREYTELLASYQSALGADHNYTLLARAGLGEAYTEVGRVAEGIQLMEAAIPGLEALFGPGDPGIARYRDVIADARAQAAD
jgi:tetratricopeptide (TPR) repeat protein